MIIPGPYPNYELDLSMSVIKLKKSEIDVFAIPVHPDAAKLPMIPADELEELAEDIKENGLNDPVVVGKVNDEWMLIDGRNRLAACKLVGVTPAYRILDIAPDAGKLKSFIWSVNGTRRQMTSSQRAMSFAMLFPEAKRGGDRKSDQVVNLLHDRQDIDRVVIYRARFILKHDPEKAELVKEGHPDYPLTKTYETVKKDVAEREEGAEKERRRMKKVEAIHKKYPDLAQLVKEERLSLDQALTLAEKQDKEEEQKVFNQCRSLYHALSEGIRGMVSFSFESNAVSVLEHLENGDYPSELAIHFPEGWETLLRNFERAMDGINRLGEVFAPILEQSCEVNEVDGNEESE